MKNTITRTRYKQYEADLKAYNKRLKQQGRHSECLTLEQFIDYCHGKSPVQRKNTFKEYKPAEPFRRETPDYPSLSTNKDFTCKVTPNKYTGTLIKGIAQTHKSNAIPVIDSDHIKDIAKMRR